MDLAKYRALFLEEATEHLAEMSRALLELEKEPARGEAIDLVFRHGALDQGHGGARSTTTRSPSSRTGSRTAWRTGARRAACDAPGRACRCCSAGSRASSAWSARCARRARRRRPTPSCCARAARRRRRGRGPRAERGAPRRRRARAERRRPREPPPAAPRAAALGPRAHRDARPLPVVRRRGDPDLEPAAHRRPANAPRRRRSSRSASTAWSAWSASSSAARSRCAPRRCCASLDALPRAAREVAASLGKQRRGRAARRRARARPLDPRPARRPARAPACATRSTTASSRPSARRAAGKPEAGRIEIDARRERDTIRISVARRRRAASTSTRCARAPSKRASLHADLAGDLPPEEIAALVFRPGLSTGRSGVGDLRARRRHGRGARRPSRRSAAASSSSSQRRARHDDRRSLVPITAAVQRVLLVGLGDGAGRDADREGRAHRRDAEPRRSSERAARRSRSSTASRCLVLDLAERLGIERRRARPRSCRWCSPSVRGQRVALQVERLDRAAGDLREAAAARSSPRRAGSPA